MKQEFNGTWYLSEFSQQRIPGVLKVDDNQIELTLYSNVDLEGRKIEGFGETIRDFHSVILGETLHQKITVFNAEFESSHPIDTNLTILRLSADLVIEGAHLTNLNDPLFSTVTTSFTYLTHWMDEQQFIYEKIETPLKDLDPRVNKLIRIDVADDYTITIDRFVRKKNITDTHKLSYQIHHSVIISNTKNKSFYEFLNKTNELKRFIELGVNTPIGTSITCAGDLTNGQRYWVHQAKRAVIFNKDPNSFRAKHQMLFSYRILGSTQFEMLVQNWFRTINTHLLIYDIFLDTHLWFEGTGAYISHIMFQNRILNVIQGLEAYHTVKYKHEEETKEEFKNSLKAICLALSSADKKWLKKRTHSASKSLSERLQYIIEDFRAITKDIITSKQQVLSFIDDLTEIRNSLSHGRKMKPITNKMSTLYNISRILLLCCILQNLGLENKRIVELVTRCDDYRTILVYLSQHRHQFNTTQN